MQQTLCMHLFHGALGGPRILQPFLYHNSPIRQGSLTSRCTKDRVGRLLFQNVIGYWAQSLLYYATLFRNWGRTIATGMAIQHAS